MCGAERSRSRAASAVITEEDNPVSQELFPSRRKRVLDLLGALERDIDPRHRAAVLYELRQALEAYFVEREEVVSYGVRAVLGARVPSLRADHDRCRAAFARVVELRYDGFPAAFDRLCTLFRALDEPPRRRAA